MTDRSELAAHLQALNGVNVLCIGDVMLDRYIYGEVERISPEGPIPVLRIEREEAMLGGAGNVVRNLVALGARVTFITVVGDDEAGREVTALIGDSEAVEPYLVVEKGRQTTIKTRYIATSQQLLRTDRETVAPIAATSRNKTIRLGVEIVADNAAVVLSDYGKGVLAPDLVAKVIAAARNANKPVVVDPKGLDYGRYRGASVVTPNRRELAETTRMAAGDDDQVVAAARRLMEGAGLAAVLVTRGVEGMTLVTEAGAADHFPAETHEVFDVSGAGDTVNATLAAALGAGVPLPEAARLANVAAGIVVGKVGTAVAHAEEVLTALHTQDLLTGEAKIAAPARALDRVNQWRHQGLKIGFTNGCFDLFHPGHVSLLAQARAACDRLVVGLNSDASTTRLKGPDRPIQNEAARAAVLVSLATVDLVVIFNEDTPIRLIEAIRPEVLVKGADYTIDQVVGAEFVKSYGGSVLLAEISRGHGTTETISKVAGRKAAPD